MLHGEPQVRHRLMEGASSRKTSGRGHQDVAHEDKPPCRSERPRELKVLEEGKFGKSAHPLEGSATGENALVAEKPTEEHATPVG